MAEVCFAARSRYGGTILEHEHRWLELVLMLEGTSTVLSGQREVAVGPGDLLIHPPGERHAHTGGAISTVYCGLNDTGAFPGGFRVLPIPHGDVLERWMTDIAITMMGGEPDLDDDTMSHLADAVLARVRALEGQATPSGHPALVQICATVLGDLTQDWNLSGLADEVGVSTGHLNLLARRHLGCGLQRWIEDRRIELARRLLRDPYRDIAAVAMDCGYQDPNYFARVFRKRIGCSPGQWRRGDVSPSPS
ncbi:MAG: AraC family transcriptional regulator [Planctomycetota bacterium]|jgi:AraC-like DNA-binding protein|nr:AraC family transcriptional regulator [Planctomycetota bacterium]